MARRRTPSRSSWDAPSFGAHQEGADQRGDNAHRGYEEGQDYVQVRATVERDGCAVGDHSAQGGGGDNRTAIALEEVGAHAGHIAHVVAHIVGDDRGVARVVFGDALLHFAHKVCAHVGGFCIDAAANAGKEGDRAGAEAEAVT